MLNVLESPLSFWKEKWQVRSLLFSKTCSSSEEAYEPGSKLLIRGYMGIP